MYQPVSWTLPGAVGGLMGTQQHPRKLQLAVTINRAGTILHGNKTDHNG